MEANELRVGDWVKCRGNLTKVESIDENGINQELSGGYYVGEYEKDYIGYFTDNWFNQALIEPIVLSPEILGKCNAIKDNYGLFYLRRDGSNKSESGMDIVLTIKECLVNDIWVWECSVGDMENSINLCFINFLHELQNLFWCLTGKELNITL